MMSKFASKEHLAQHLIQENKCLDELNGEFLAVLLALLEFWDNGTAVHPSALLVDEVRTVVAKAKGLQALDQ